jgi:hypothetical protein
MPELVKITRDQCARNRFLAQAHLVWDAFSHGDSPITLPDSFSLPTLQDRFEIMHYCRDSGFGLWSDALLLRLMEDFTYEWMRACDPKLDRLDEIAVDSWDQIPTNEEGLFDMDIPELHEAVGLTRTAFAVDDPFVCLRFMHKAVMLVASFLVRKSDGRTPGMDDVAAAILFVVVSARPPRFASMMEYLLTCFCALLARAQTPEVDDIVGDCIVMGYGFAPLLAAAKLDPRFGQGWQFALYFQGKSDCPRDEFVVVV